MHRPATAAIAALLLLAAATERVCARAKTDTVFIRNGDRVTCEIKQLEEGILQVKTDDMGTLNIEWTKVIALESGYYFRVEASTGARFFGTPHLEQGDSVMRVTSVAAVAAIDIEDVVSITPIERSFWSRFDGTLSLGFSYTRASDVAQLTFDWTNLIRMERDLIDSKANTIITDKGTSEETSRKAELNTTWNRLLKKKWTGSVYGAIQRNDELGIRRRLIASIGSGVNAIRSNRQVLQLTAGVALNSELGTDSTGTNESMEGVLTTSYSFFRYDSPKSDINTVFTFYPSFTESQRYRVEFNIVLSHELVSDFFFDLSYYLSYDSKSPNAQGEKGDYGIVTSVSWKY
jgi:hypothetical protein